MVKAMAMQWYSWGLWSGQFLIAWRCQVLGHMHLVFAFASIYFPIELWIKSNAHHKIQNLFATSFIAVFYFVEEDYNYALQILLSIAYFVYSYWFSGKFWKRAPLPGVDFDEKEVDKKMKKKLNLRRSMTLGRYAFGFISRMVASNTPLAHTAETNTVTVTNVKGDEKLAFTNEPSMRSVSRSCSLARQTMRRRKSQNINQESLAKMIQNALNGEFSAEQIAAQIANRVSDGSLAYSPMPLHPMMMAEAMSPLEELEDCFAVSPGNVFSRTPSVRNHDHY